MAELPAESPYRKLVYPSFVSVIRQLVANSRAATRAQKQVEQTVAA